MMSRVCGYGRAPAEVAPSLTDVLWSPSDTVHVYELNDKEGENTIHNSIKLVAFTILTLLAIVCV